MDHLIKPNKLKPGDKVAVISLSWGGPGTFPYRYEKGIERLESIFELEVIPTKCALKDQTWLYNNPLARAEDLMNAFRDSNIKGIFSSIGGDDSIRLLPYIDFNIIRQNPKIFIGFSDTTVNHFICLKAGISSFYGPSIMTAFAENIEMFDYSIQGIKRTLFSNEIIGEIPQNKQGWTNELLDWADPLNQNIKRKLEPSIDWKFMGFTQKPVIGRLIGGCIESLQIINGTSIWPTIDIWRNAIIFLEISEDGMSPIALTCFLRNLATQGILKVANGILFSKPGGQHIKVDHFNEYDDAIIKVIDEYSLCHISIVSNMDFGHTDPMWTLPYGCLTEIDPINKRVVLLEAGTTKN